MASEFDRERKPERIREAKTPSYLKMNKPPVPLGFVDYKLALKMRQPRSADLPDPFVFVCSIIITMEIF